MPTQAASSAVLEIVTTRGPAQTQALARALLARLPPRCVLALHGELGSGKTCFVQGLAAALGVTRTVTSPTFTLVNEYRGGTRPLFHVDLYRLAAGRDLEMLGLDECFESDGITAIEWAERAATLLPPDAVHIRFETLPGKDRRRVTLTGLPTPARSDRT